MQAAAIPVGMTAAQARSRLLRLLALYVAGIPADRGVGIEQLLLAGLIGGLLTFGEVADLASQAAGACHGPAPATGLYGVTYRLH